MNIYVYNSIMLSIVIYRLCGLRIYKTITILTYLPQTPPRCPTLPFFEGEQIIDEFHCVKDPQVSENFSSSPGLKWPQPSHGRLPLLFSKSFCGPVAGEICGNCLKKAATSHDIRSHDHIDHPNAGDLRTNGGRPALQSSLSGI